MRSIFWLWCAASLGALGVYLAMIFWTLPAITAGAGGLRPFDLRPFGYDAQAAHAFLDALSAEAQAIYTGPQRVLDLFYPALLTILVIGALRALLSHGGLFWGAAALMLVGMCADYAENFFVAGLLAAGPSASAAQISLASAATVIKSMAGGTAMLVMLVAGATAALRRMRGRR